MAKKTYVIQQDDFFGHRLLCAEDARAGAWANYRGISVLDGHCSVTDYWTRNGNQVWSAKKFMDTFALIC